MTYCAVCADPAVTFSYQPLGRDDALVAVCAACDSPPVAKHGPERTYEPGDRTPSIADWRRGKRTTNISSYVRRQRRERAAR